MQAPHGGADHMPAGGHVGHSTADRMAPRATGPGNIREGRFGERGKNVIRDLYVPRVRHPALSVPHFPLNNAASPFLHVAECRSPRQTKRRIYYKPSTWKVNREITS